MIYGSNGFCLTDGGPELHHAAGTIVAACPRQIGGPEASRGTYGELSLRDPVTLEPVHDQRLECNFARAVVKGGRVRLHTERSWAEYDVAARAFVASGAGPDQIRASDACLSADEALVVELRSRDEEGTWWSTEMGTNKLLVDGKKTPMFWGEHDVDPASGRLATSHRDGRVRLWDARSGALLREIDAGIATSGVRWFPDGRALLAWSSEGALTELPVH